MFLPEHRTKAGLIVDLFLENRVRSGYYGVLNICGISGTGKTEIASDVHRELYLHGISSHIVNMDKFYRVNADVRNTWRKKTKTIGHEEMDWNKIEKELMIFDNNDIQVLIFEGLYAGYVEGGITFYIEGNIESTDEFRKLRGKEDEEDLWRQHVVAMEYSDILANSHNHDYKI